MAAVSLAPQLRLRWIADARTDLLFLIGGAAAGFALFATHAVFAWDVRTVWLVWYVTSNLPHFFGTYVRTYLDPVERARRPRLLYGSLLWALAGPLALVMALGLYAAGAGDWHRAPVQGLFVFAALWAYWHVVRQHYGVLCLYRRKNADAGDGLLDKAFLYVGLVAPLVAFVILLPQARDLLQLPEEPSGAEHALATLSAAAVAVLALAFVARQAERWRGGEPVNGPKVLFLLAVVSLHAFVGFHPATRTAGLLGFAAYVTVFHDVQYQAIVWHAQRARLADGRPHGLAAWVCSRFAVYYGCALAMGVGLWAVGCALNVQPGCTPLVDAAEVPLFAELTLKDLAALTVLGFAMHHYFLDQFIWRPSQDAGLRRELA